MPVRRMVLSTDELAGFKAQLDGGGFEQALISFTGGGDGRVNLSVNEWGGEVHGDRHEVRLRIEGHPVVLKSDVAVELVTGGRFEQVSRGMRSWTEHIHHDEGGGKIRTETVEHQYLEVIVRQVGIYDESGAFHEL